MACDPGAAMSPLLLVMMMMMMTALNTESTAVLPEVSTGKEFTVAFPENIAYYHPVQPINVVQITALYPNTFVYIRTDTFHNTNQSMSTGESREFILDARIELHKKQISNKTVYISSTQEITVHAINGKDNSVQTALVIPTDKLGTEYLIPPVPTISGTTDMVTEDVTERNPFKVVIVNTGQTNQVSVEGTDDITLQPNQVAQIWIQDGGQMKTVTAEKPVSVLFGHTCAIRKNCTCGPLYTMLPPATGQKLKYYIPPVLATGAEDKTFLLLSEKDTQPFNPDSPWVETSGTAILYRPGLLLTLIPEEDFVSCSVVKSLPYSDSFVVIVVHKDHTVGVHLGKVPVESEDWLELKGTDYVSKRVQVFDSRTVIWHAFHKMAVYFVGFKGEALFGNPAPIISKNPDFRGCVLSPEVVKIGEEANGWRESVQYCRDQGMELVSLPEVELQKQVQSKTKEANKDELTEVWIGMRRSSLTGEWYWLNKAPVNNTNWMDGEPGSVQDGQCVIMSLDKDMDFGWRDEDCCKAAHPVCYKTPVFLPL